ncbi:MAG: hypothetical protein IGR92_08485 [Leptolyngbyaceae cyanobacterium T60_A2020_046]|nr:hypothetical protein [Leptolyngbyaceae cyanobacterium T60_A2020_046]
MGSLSHWTLSHWIGIVAGLGVMLAIAPSPALPPHGHGEPDSANRSEQFQKIDQPLWLKLIVITGGLGLMGAELWWFVFSQPSAKNPDGGNQPKGNSP